MERGRQMKVQIDPHTLERAEERGTDEDEIKDVIKTGFTISAKYGRMGKAILKIHPELPEMTAISIFRMAATHMPIL